MPKSTFSNLPAEKRDRITQCIIEEFAENTYESASINQIVKNADIAKGSFYQYFEDKLDIYKMAIEICQEEKMKYIEGSQKNTRYLDSFTLIRELYISIIQFEIDKPKLSSIMYMYHKSSDLELKNKVEADVDICDGFEIKKILDEGIEKSRIYYNIDVQLVTFLLESMIVNIKEYLKIKRRTDKHVDYKGLINTAVDLVENGIKLKKKRKIDDIL